MRLTCPDCDTSFEAPRGPDSRAVPCPSCGRQLDVPGAGDLNLVGATFAGVHIDGVVAKGSRSIVYRGRDDELGTLVAVKVLTVEGEASGPELERFEREARAASRLRHPNIVAVHRVGKEAAKPYIVMDYVMGRTLAIRTDAGPLPTRSAMAIISSLASAVQHAHENGIVHRDLKPENILFDESGSPRIMDFGLARDVHAADLDDGTEGKIVGTPAYMPPEQASALTAEVDQQSDIYSLGAVLYEMLTGHPPFAGVTTALLIKKVRENEPPAPSSLRPDIHPDAETICLRAMARTKARRYATAAELGRDAEAFLSGKRIEAVPPGVAEKTPRWVWRHRIAALTLAIAAVAVAAFAWNVWGARARLRESREGARKGKLSQLVASADECAARWRAHVAKTRAEPGAASARKTSTDAAAWTDEDGRAESDFAKALGCYLRALDAAPSPTSGAVPLSRRAKGGGRRGRGRPESEREIIRDSLAALLDDGLRDAERRSRAGAAGMAAKAATLRELARAYCPARLDDILSATATLRIGVAPRRAPVRLRRLAASMGEAEGEGGEGRTQEAAPAKWRELGAAPVLPVELRAGRFLIETTAPGHAGVRLPVTLERGARMHVFVRLPKAGRVSEGFVMVCIPSTGAAAAERRSGDGPPAFAIGRTEVTVAEYRRFVDSLPQAERRAMMPGPGSDTPVAAAPVTGVSAAQARAYCRWLSKKSSRRYRLPTATEWTLAAGSFASADADAGALYPWGRSFDAGRVAVGSAAGPGPVGGHPGDESPCGALDMAGSVSEWVEADSVDGSGELPPPAVDLRMGGSYLCIDAAEYTTASPRTVPRGVRDRATGFRVVCELGQ